MKHVSESSDRKTDIQTARTSMPRQVRRPRSPALLPGSEPQGAQGTQTYGRGKLRSRIGGCRDLARPARLTLSAGAAAAEPLPGSEAGTERAAPTGAVCRWRPLPEAGPLGTRLEPTGRGLGTCPRPRQGGARVGTGHRSDVLAPAPALGLQQTESGEGPKVVTVSRGDPGTSARGPRP